MSSDAKSQRKLLLTVVLAACDIETTTITTTSVKDGDRFNSIFLPYLRPSNKWHNSNSSSAPDHFAQLYTHYGNQSCCDLKMEHKKKNQALQCNDTVLLNGEPLYPYFMKKISQVWTWRTGRRFASHRCNAIVSRILEERRFFSTQVCENCSMFRIRCWFGLGDGFKFYFR